MNRFLELNKAKVYFMIKFCLIIFGSIIYGGMLIFIYSKEETINIVNNILLAFLTILGITFWIFILAYFSWYIRSKIRDKLFQNPPLNRLSEIGFQNYLKNEKTKLYFTETVRAGYVSDYFITIDLKENSLKTICFKTFVDYQKIDTQKEERLKTKNINLNTIEASKDYTTKEINKLSFSKLKNDLEQFTRILSYEKLKPL
jgi:hypothetical protein